MNTYLKIQASLMEDTDPAASVLLEDLDKAETSREVQEALDKYDLATQS